MTPDELDRARAHEAVRLAMEAGKVSPFENSLIAARLAREGWEPVDPLEAEVDLLLNGEGWGRGGMADRVIRKALERGIEIGKGR